MVLPFQEFEVILGIDWLFEHDASLRCRAKCFMLRDSDEARLMVKGRKKHCLSNVVSEMATQRMIYQGCEAYLAHVVNTRVESLMLASLPTVKEFIDVFQAKLLTNVVTVK
ncbi:hypothetical protein GQ457_15G013250 [Hibiscus cannabinus]